MAQFGTFEEMLRKKFAYIQFKFDFKDRCYFPTELHHQSASDQVLREPWSLGTLRGPSTHGGRLFSLQGPALTLWSSFLPAPSPHSWPMTLSQSGLQLSPVPAAAPVLGRGPCLSCPHSPV